MMHALPPVLEEPDGVRTDKVSYLPQVRPQPVIQPLPPGFAEVETTIPGLMLVPLTVEVILTTAKSLGVKPDPEP